ncbi:MAG: hypothetical protein GY910_06485 [bacterium]|nr:hypothetical protein [bacterium]
MAFRRDTRITLGVHMIGVAASELIHIGMMLLHTDSTLDQILSAVFNHPTLSEIYRVAALDGINRLLRSGLQKAADGRSVERVDGALRGGYKKVRQWS